MENQWKIMKALLLLISLSTLFFTLAAPKRVIVDEKPQISFKNEIQDKDHVKFTIGLRGRTDKSKTLKPDEFTCVNWGFMEKLRNFSYVGNAWAGEWECNDPNYPINCDNGVCCEVSSYCYSMHCCRSGSLCCQTGCCPSGYPWYCPENNRCYERYDDASVKCGSILQECR